MEHVMPIIQPLVLLISFSVVMKMCVKPSVFASKFQLFDIDRLLHLKHTFCIDVTAWYSTKVKWLTSYISCPCLVAAPFHLLKVIVAMAINW